MRSASGRVLPINSADTNPVRPRNRFRPGRQGFYLGGAVHSQARLPQLIALLAAATICSTLGVAGFTSPHSAIAGADSAIGQRSQGAKAFRASHLVVCVRDSLGGPIGRISVGIADGGRDAGGHTDSSGTFVLARVTPGLHEVTVRSRVHEPFDATLDFQASGAETLIVKLGLLPSWRDAHFLGIMPDGSVSIRKGGTWYMLPSDGSTWVLDDNLKRDYSN